MSDVRMEGLTLQGSLSIGSGGTKDYNRLINKPTYEGITIEGDLTASDLGIATSEELGNLSSDVTDLQLDLQTTNTNVGNLRTDLQTETTNRSNADLLLQNNIDTETTNRENAIRDLQSQIDTLPSDTDLSNAILTHNTSNTAHSDIRTLISNEATTRDSADDNLQNQIDALPSSEDITSAISQHNSSNVAHNDIRQLISTEANNRANGDNDLQTQIDALVSKSDIVDIVGTYQDLLNYDTSTLGNNDIVKVLNDSTHDNAMSYYRWNLTTWVYVGSEGTYYTKSESDSRYVPVTRTVNGKALSSNISLDYSDVGALSDTTVIPNKTSDLTNDSGYQNATQVSTSISSALSGYATETWVQNYIASLDATNVRY